MTKHFIFLVLTTFCCILYAENMLWLIFVRFTRLATFWATTSSGWFQPPYLRYFVTHFNKCEDYWFSFAFQGQEFYERGEMVRCCRDRTQRNTYETRDVYGYNFIEKRLLVTSLVELFVPGWTVADMNVLFSLSLKCG